MHHLGAALLALNASGANNRVEVIEVKGCVEKS
jgi:hypothetical protein